MGETRIRLDRRLFEEPVPEWFPGRVVNGTPVPDTNQLEQFARWVAYIHHRTTPRKIAKACGFREAPFYRLRSGDKTSDGRHVQRFAWELARLLARNLDLGESSFRPFTVVLMTLAILQVDPAGGGEWHKFATQIQHAKAATQ